MIQKIIAKTSFNSGEVSPKLQGRIDVEKYKGALAEARNSVCHPHGPISRRQGTKYINDCASHSQQSKLIPFQVTNTIALVLEFSDGIIRFFTNGGTLLDTKDVENGTFVSGIDGWDDLSVSPASISHDAINSFLQLNGAGGGAFAAAEQQISLGTGSYTLSVDVNVVGDVGYTIGSVTGGSDIDSGTLSPGAGQTVTFSPATHGSVFIGFNNVNADTRSITNISIVNNDEYRIDSPYTSDDLSKLSYTQNTNTLFIAHEDYPPRALVRLASTVWAFSDISFAPPPTYEPGHTPDAVLTLNDYTGDDVTVTASELVFLSADQGRQITLKNSTGRALITNVIDFQTVQVDFIEDFPTNLVIQSGDWQLDLSPVCALDPDGIAVGSICAVRSLHPEGRVGPRYYTSSVSESKPTNNPPIDTRVIFKSGNVPGWTHGMKIVCHDVLPTSIINDVVTPVEQRGSLTYDLILAPSNGHPDGSTPTGYCQRVLTNVAISAFGDSDVGKYILIHGGVLQILEVVSNDLIYCEVKKSLNESTSTSGWTLEEPTWSAERGYPRCVGLNQNRLVFGGTTAQPQTVWWSEIGILDGFGAGPDDNDSFQRELSDSEVPIISWVAGSHGMIIGTTSSESTIEAASTNAALTPEEASQRLRTFHGSDVQNPLRVGSEVVFVQNSRKSIRSFRYDFNIDNYIAEDLLFLAAHFTENGPNLVDLAYQKDFNQVIYAILSDGTMLAGTYLREQQVIGWCLWETDGLYESITTLTKDTGTEVWVTVKRIIDGEVKRYIELLDNKTVKNPLGSYVDSFLEYNEPLTITNITKANPVVVTAVGHGLSNDDHVKLISITGMDEVNNLSFVVKNKTDDTFQLYDYYGNAIDGTSYTAYVEGGEAHKLITSVTGLDHLEGKEVSIRADGAVHNTKIVTSGQVTLDYECYKLIAGLSYTTTLTTLPIDYDLGLGSMQGQQVRWLRPIIKVYSSTTPILNGKYLPSRSTSDFMDQAVPLYTGNLSYKGLNWTDSNTLTFTVSEPLPFNISALYGTVDAGVL